MEYEKGVVPWGEDAFLDGSRLRFSREDSRQSVLITAAALLLASTSLISGIVVDQRWENSLTSSEEQELPSLLDDTMVCPVSDPAGVEHHAEMSFRQGIAKRERFPFDAREGVAAAALLAEAKSCFEACGNVKRAGEARQEHEAWTRELDQRVRTLAITLHRALAAEQHHRALMVSSTLRQLLYEERQGPFVGWLQTLEKRLLRELAAQREVFQFGGVTSE